jgi:hypothetical protein
MIIENLQKDFSPWWWWRGGGGVGIFGQLLSLFVLSREKCED